MLEHVGEIPKFDFEPKDHLELGESLGLIDMERGAKVSGSRFYFMTGYGAMLQLGLLQLAAQKAIANGFTMMIPPVLVRPESWPVPASSVLTRTRSTTCRMTTCTSSELPRYPWPATTRARSSN